MPVLLIVINNIEFLYSHRLPVALGAADAGYEVHIATCFNNKDPLLHADKLIYHYVSFNRNSTNPLKDVKSCYQLYVLYKKLKPTLIHHVGMKPILYGSLVARLTTDISYINAISGLGYLFINQSFKSICIRQLLLLGLRLGFEKNRTYFIFQNNDDHDLFQKKCLIKNDQITFIRGSGVDLQLFQPQNKTHEYVLIVFPARLLWDKGLSEFIEVARILNNKQVRFVLVGDVDILNPRSAFLTDIDAWVNEGILEYWGWRNDMEKIFQEADIVCLPSYREGVPKSLLEAAASGLPIITTDAPGCRDVVIDGVNGFLVPVKNVDLLVERLRQLIQSSLLRETMGRLSRERAEQLFDIKKVVEQHLLLYHELE